VVEIAEPTGGDEAARALAGCLRAAVQPRADEIVRKVAEESRWEAPITFALEG
jgi:hypothetical protein